MLDKIKTFLDNADATHANQYNLPESIAEFITLHPEIIFDVLTYYKNIGAKPNPYSAKTCLWVMLACFDAIKYELDRGSVSAQALFDSVKETLKTFLPTLGSSQLIDFNQLLHESSLPFFIGDDALSFTELFSHQDDQSPDIVPDLPELLEKLKRETKINSSYELCEALIAQLQVMALPIQLSVLQKLAASKKAMPHEVSILLLLHPNTQFRTMAPKVLLSLVQDKVFTPVDLRRMIVIRNWLLEEEREPLDSLIQTIRRSGIAPAPYPVASVNQLIASVFDGAGAQLIAFQVKHRNQRILGGLILKCGIGIRDPWVMMKAAKGEFKQLLVEDNGLERKPVSRAYVNKAIRHFLAQGQIHHQVPNAYLLQISELMGAKDWQPQRIQFDDELHRLQSKLAISLEDNAFVKKSLATSAQWLDQESFFHSWFECGENAERCLVTVMKAHKAQFSHGIDAVAEALTTDAIIEPVRDKWKTILLFMCLWSRSKVIKKPLWQDCLVLVDQLQKGVKPSEIPMFRQMTQQSVGSIMARLRNV